MSNITSDGTVMGGTPFFGGMNNWDVTTVYLKEKQIHDKMKEKM